MQRNFVLLETAVADCRLADPGDGCSMVSKAHGGADDGCPSQLIFTAKQVRVVAWVRLGETV